MAGWNMMHGTLLVMYSIAFRTIVLWALGKVR